jgi:hypothetical protein
MCLLLSVSPSPSPHSFQFGSGAHTEPYPMGCLDLFPLGWGVKPITHLDLVQR